MDNVVSEFGLHTEEGIVSLALDMPEVFDAIAPYIKPDLFSNLSVKYVMAWLLNLRDKYGVMPTRGLLKDKIIKQLTVDMPYEPILAVIDRPSDPREVPAIREGLREWARMKAYGLLYEEDTITAYQKRDFAKLQQIFDAASQINDVGYRGFWLDGQVEELLVENSVQHLSTGFKRLDMALNNGGPSPGEACIVMAATNVGKSMFLCNLSANSITAGYDTLHITCEMSHRRSAARVLGALTMVSLKEFHSKADFLREHTARFFATHKAKLAVYEFAPEEISVNDISALIAHLRKTKGWQPKVVVIDYLELLLSKRDYYNREEYVRQKHVATEVCGFAKLENVLCYSATQTNRSGVNAGGSSEVNDLNKMAESYGKGMPPDYVLSLNQSLEEYHSNPPQLRVYIAKNREGPKFETIQCNVMYNCMKIIEGGM